MNDILVSSKKINVKKHSMNKKSNKARTFVYFTMKKFSRKRTENFNESFETNKNVKKERIRNMRIQTIL